MPTIEPALEARRLLEVHGTYHNAMIRLLETLRALAPVVTPGEWQHHMSHVYGPDPDRQLVCQFRNGPWLVSDRDLIVTLRNNLPTIIAALEVVDLVRDEDWLAERISDSLDVDWRPIDAARAIIAALPKEEV